jgi:hypothetical protein
MFSLAPEEPVRLTEFADYETKSVGKAHLVIKKVLTAYRDKVRFSFQHYPLLTTRCRCYQESCSGNCRLLSGDQGINPLLETCESGGSRFLGTIGF